MSRYIRTKDRLYELGSETRDGAYLLVKAKGSHTFLSKKEPILKEADTIDELCDCYLEDHGKGIPAIITKTMWVDFHMEKSLRKETTFYACIIKRDSKGTHIEPVAKLNEKGEFELL